MNWDLQDFVLFAIMIILLSAGLFATKRLVKERKRRLLTGLSLILVFLLVWIELAVGIFD